MAPVLQVKNLSVSFSSERGKHLALENVSFALNKGKTLAIVGESGCGKSVTALSIMGLLPQQIATIESGTAIFENKNLLELPNSKMQYIRGKKIAMIFQEPMTALNPVFTVGNQLSEVFQIHYKMNKKDAWEKSREMLERVKIPAPAERLHNYPFELSGGMRQRVMIAMALACNPDILIADEPTTALDVTIQAQILRLIKELQEEFETAVMFITHDLGVVAEVADEVLVMYAGRAIEHGDVYQVFDSPKHPYTRGLLSSIPTIDSLPDEELPTIKGMVPSLFDRDHGCLFFDRCHKAKDKCKKTIPNLDSVTASHNAACHFIEEVY